MDQSITVFSFERDTSDVRYSAMAVQLTQPIRMERKVLPYWNLLRYTAPEVGDTLVQQDLGQVSSYR